MPVPRKPDVEKAKKAAHSAALVTLNRYNDRLASADYPFLRWIATMTAVELYSVWERYAEVRLVGALCRRPEHFIEENSIRAVRHVSLGLAKVLVRGPSRFFDCRSVGELIEKADHLLGREANPFRGLRETEKKLLDVLSAIRNYVVHKSDYAHERYRRKIVEVYRMKAIPEPGEFLHAAGRVPGYSVPRGPRISGIGFVVLQAVRHS